MTPSPVILLNRAVATRDAVGTDAAFFFSSRRRHTRSLRDWSSDVCSSDLVVAPEPGAAPEPLQLSHVSLRGIWIVVSTRSEERRVGKECRSRWSPYH